MEAERLEAERLEAERLAAEEEAARLEAERAEAERLEAERVAAEEEAARLEAERLEAERVEAERVEAERLEAERVAAEEEAARLEAERVASEQLARDEMARWAAEEAARAVAEAQVKASYDREQAEILGRSFAEPVPALEQSPWEMPVVFEEPAAYQPEVGLAPAAAVSFADVYGGTDLTGPRTFGDIAAEQDLDEASPESLAIPEPVTVPETPRSTPDYSGGFVVSPEVAEPGASEGADMAALMRELSSLNSGAGDAEGVTTRPGVAGMSPAGAGGQQGQTVSRPVQAADTKAKKKKGFFGR